MSASGSTSGGLSSGLRLMGSALVTWLTVLLIGGIFLGAPIAGSVFGGSEQAIAWTAIVALAIYAGWNADQFSIPFALSFVAVLMLLGQFLPDWLTSPFAFIGESLGLQGTLEAIDPTSFAVLVGATIVAYWAFTIRLFGRGKKPSTVTSRVRVQAERLTREYAKMTRIVFAFGFAVVFIAAGEGGELLGELARMVGAAPVVSGFAATIAAFWGSYIRGLPVIGDLDPVLFAVLATLVFAVVVGVKYND